MTTNRDTLRRKAASMESVRADSRLWKTFSRMRC